MESTDSPTNTASEATTGILKDENIMTTPGPTPIDELMKQPQEQKEANGQDEENANNFAQQMTDSIYSVHSQVSNEIQNFTSNSTENANAPDNISNNEETEEMKESIITPVTAATEDANTASTTDNTTTATATDNTTTTTTTDTHNTTSTTTTTDNTTLSPQVIKEQLKYCQRILKGLKRHREAGPFLLPVDPVALNIPDYLTVIKQPMDLGTISKKLDLNQYGTAENFMADVRLMLTNCFTYNAPDSQVTKMGRNIEKYFNTSMAKMPNEIGTFTAAAPKATSSGNSPNNARPKRESVSGAASSTARRVSSAPGASLTFCSSVLRELMKKTNTHLNWPFMIPVDPVALNLPDYFDVVKEPMDLGTIRKKLDTGAYARPENFEADVHLVFSNCYAYNPPDSDVTRMARELEAIFDQKMAQKPTPKAQQQGHHHHHSNNSTSSVASSSAASMPSTFIPSSASQLIPGLDSFEDDSEKILAINHQIQILQAELNFLLINRKSSSSSMASSASLHRTGNASASSTSAAKPPRKKASSNLTTNAVNNKATPSSATTPQSNLMADISFDEKRQLSEDVSTLSQDNMMRVLEIIQECMPNLNSNGDSDVIELDIEALDVRTLRALQQYIWECQNPGKKRKMTKSPSPIQQHVTQQDGQEKKTKIEAASDNAGQAASNYDSSSSSSSEDDD